MVSSEQSVMRERSDEIDVIALLQVLWRYKYFVMVVAAIFSVVAIYMALAATPIYRAEVVVTEVQDDGAGGTNSLMRRFGGLASIAGFNLSGATKGLESKAVLRSRYLAEEFIRRNDLAAELLPSGDQRQTIWFAVRSFLERVRGISEDKDRGTITVTIEWTDPEVAARWANQYVALANELLRKRALDDANRNIQYLNEQIAKTDVVEIQRVMYSLVESETKTQMLANAREEYAFTIVDPAVAPEQRIKPRRTLMVLTGGVLGLLVGSFLAFAHNVWSRYRSSS